MWQHGFSFHPLSAFTKQSLSIIDTFQEWSIMSHASEINWALCHIYFHMTYISYARTVEALWRRHDTQPPLCTCLRTCMCVMCVLVHVGEAGVWTIMGSVCGCDSSWLFSISAEQKKSCNSTLPRWLSDWSSVWSTHLYMYFLSLMTFKKERWPAWARTLAAPLLGAPLCIRNADLAPNLQA